MIDKERKQAYCAKWRAEHPGYMDAWREENKKHVKKYDKKYRKEHKVARRFYGKNYMATIRAETLKAYGGECECCGEKTPEFLGINYRYGKSAEYKRSLGIAYTLYKKLQQKGYPPDFRLLCYNCNFCISRRGFCPHKVAENNAEVLE